MRECRTDDGVAVRCRSPSIDKAVLENIKVPGIMFRIVKWVRTTGATRAGAGLRVPLSPGCGGPGDRTDRCQFHGSRQGAWTVLGGRQRAPTWMNAESTLIVSGTDSRLAASASGLAGPVQSGSCGRQRGCDHGRRVRALERR